MGMDREELLVTADCNSQHEVAGLHSDWKNCGCAPDDEGRGEKSFLNRKQLFARKKIVRHKKCVNRVSRYEKLFVLVFSFRRLLSLTKANHPSRRAANQPPVFPHISTGLVVNSFCELHTMLSSALLFHSLLLLDPTCSVGRSRQRPFPHEILIPS